MTSLTSFEELSHQIKALESKIDLLVQQKSIKEWYTTSQVAAILDQNLQRSRGASC